MNTETTIELIRKNIKNISNATYRIRIIHGYHGGTRIREAIEDEFSYGREAKVKRITQGNNPEITELIIREYTVSFQKEKLRKYY